MKEKDMNERKAMRKAYYVDHKFISEIARDVKCSRNTVRKYVFEDDEPKDETPSTHEQWVMTDEVKDFVKECLRQDEEEGTKRQRHTARRIYDRLVEERGFTGGESTVRRYVSQVRAELKPREVFVPLYFAPGEAMQVDFGEIRIYKKGESEKTTVQMFCARLCYSEAPFVKVYRKQTTQSFVDGIVSAVKFFGGVPRKVIFDNGSVGAMGGYGKDAKPVEMYERLSERFLFDTVFCNPGAGFEKGLVENLVLYGKRNFMTPLPRVEDLDSLNEQLVDGCEKYRKREIKKRGATCEKLLSEERGFLTKLPSYEFDVSECSEVRVSPYSAVCFETNYYSVPCEYANRQVTVRAYPDTLRIYCDGKEIAAYERLLDRNGHVYRLEHYLKLLEMKGRAIFDAAPVVENVPEDFRDWLEAQHLRPKETVELLRRGLAIGFGPVMRGEVPLSDPCPVDMDDDVTVPKVDITKYDFI